MNAEIISIGDEMTTGQRLDTNSQWLSERLGEIGVRVLYHSTVGDDLAANEGVFQNAIERASIVIATGGLGPTADDLTREVIAKVMGAELEFDQKSYDYIESLFAARGREMPEKNRVQAMFPTGSSPISNPEGTAPGVLAEIVLDSGHRCILFALPGVPAEMKQMYLETVQAELLNRFQGKRTIRHHLIKCFGIGESALEEQLPDLIKRGREPIVGITVHEATITLRISALAENEAACKAQMQPTIEYIYQVVGDLAFGEEHDELQDAVIRLLRAQNRTLSIIETNSGGLASQWIEAVDKQHQVFRGGCVVTEQQLAENVWVTVDLKTIQTYGLSSAEVAKEMAEKLQQQTGTDYSLALSPFPKQPQETGKPPMFYVALATPKETIAQAFLYAGHTSILKSRATKQALNLLRLTLLRQ